ncbi:trypsin-like peptidase domain-containing protein [Streptomyces sp. NPDC051183]|uniref:trypsin-like serine peptidase n=1 Tax=Streptomyces sp. NPDC051183 TaxID=3155165 RepID=UPI00341F04A4
MDPARLVDVRAGTEQESRSSGSGYLISPHLVLTARHVVADAHGRSWPRFEVRIGHPRHGTPVRRTAVLCWPDLTAGADSPVADAALLRLDEPIDVGGPPVRWGRPEGHDALDYNGIGFPLLARYGDVPHVEQLRGQLPPLATGPQRYYVLDQQAAPRADSASGRRPWSGASGTAVFCRGLLVGVVVCDDREFDHRRLHALPAEAFVGQSAFAELVQRDTGTTPRVEPV